ncbi:VTT domain-containing protein [Patescibacteria group bacterium]|nr:VTT domain-containing protein [Patescibacteria group bacterium]
MSFLFSFINVFLHLDRVLGSIITQYGTLTYLALFAIIFLETGLVITPFLPGDSLLFAAGAFAALGSLDLRILFPLLCVGAIAGDALNYWLGHTYGLKFYRRFEGRFLKAEHLERTQRFYTKYGGRTIILARFIPIVRTIAPFVAGVGQMPYAHFARYNVIGGLVWVSIFLGAGFFFGTIPSVKENFTFVILAMIVISFLPVAWEVLEARKGKKTQV